MTSYVHSPCQILATTWTDKIIAADKIKRALHVISYHGELVQSIPLQFLPLSVAGVGKHIWIYGSDKHLHKLKANETYSFTESERLPMPHGISDACVIAANTRIVAVCMPECHEVYVYDYTGDLMFVYGGNAREQLNVPRDVSVDHNNFVYIADEGNSSVVIVNGNGKLAGYVYIESPPICIDVSTTCYM